MLIPLWLDRHFCSSFLGVHGVFSCSLNTLMATRLKKKSMLLPPLQVLRHNAATPAPTSEDEEDFFSHTSPKTTLTPDLPSVTPTTGDTTDADAIFSDDTDELDNSTMVDHRDTANPGSTTDSNGYSPDALDLQNEDVETLQRKRKLPKVPSLRPTFTDATNWFSKLTPTQREHVIVYVYRTWPIIVRKGDTKYIDIIIEPFDKRMIEESHGGGKYTFYFLDSDLPKHNQLFGASLEVDINFKAPILDYTELDVHHPKNSKYVALLKRDGVLSMEGKVVDNNKSSGNSDAVTMKLVDAMLANQANAATMGRGDSQNIGQVVAKAMEMITQTLNANAQQNSPDKLLAMMQVMQKMNPAPIVPEDKTSALFMLMVQQMQTSHAQMIEILTRQNANQVTAAEPVDPLDQLEKLSAVAERLGFSRRQPVPPPKDTMDKIMEYGAPVVQGVLGIIQQQMALNTGRPVPTIPIPQPRGMGMANELESNDTNNSTPANPINPETQGNSEMNQLKMAISTFGGIILAHMDGLEKSGDMFADALVNMYGMPTYNTIAKVGPEVLLETMKSVPDFWAKALPFGETYLVEFCKTFCAYPEMLRQEQLAEAQDELDDVFPEPVKIKKEPKIN